MLDFLSNIGNVLITVINYFIGIFQSLLDLISSIPKFFVFLKDLINLMPSIFIPFALAIISISIVLFLVNRG